MKLYFDAYVSDFFSSTAILALTGRVKCLFFTKTIRKSSQLLLFSDKKCFKNISIQNLSI